MSQISPMPPAYEPDAVEASWFQRWLAADLFRADASSSKPKFSMALPPPNVTGELHMGHALNGTLQDIWARYRRMTGYEVLWQPGSDHAAIATQNVIERQLAAEGTGKEELGRERFNQRVDEWYATVGATIVEQYKELGASLDSSRLRFTMDPEYVRAVRTAFVHYWEKGWLYRGPRLVNWCPHCMSAISDLEVDWQEQQDMLYYIRYPVEGGGEVVVATVRPETMLADTGVAVHPEDDRYRELVGRHALLPLVGRRLPIIADEAVRRDFGTGALKVTPGHDPMDWEIGQRHRLPVINGMHPNGTVNVSELPAYDGRPALEARDLVVRDLEAGGYLIKTEPYSHEVGHCDRSGDVVEPLVSEQWFLKMGELAAAAIAASERGEVRWHPERYERTYLDWMRNIRDWCVSRQIWLGHQIPVYYCPNGHSFASVEEPTTCQTCGSRELIQDPDVLDTWFSSALWPFASLGWPDDTEDLRTFYPTSMNSTAREIINLWVSRMIMSGLEFMGAVPFRDVAIHCVVQSADGRRMSKSKGNVVDPRLVMRRYGADALRGWAAAVAMSTQDVRFDETRIEGFRRFANKLWNATRLIVNGLGEDPVAVPAPDGDLELVDRWILARLQSAIETTTRGIEDYEPQVSVNALYDFAWHDFCDWYLEAAKPRLRDGDAAARATSLHVLDTLLRLLHPFMPFVTEELWHRLPVPGEEPLAATGQRVPAPERDFLVRAQWPEAEERFRHAEAEEVIADLHAEVEGLRQDRTQHGARRGFYAPGPELDERRARLIGVWARVEIVEELPAGTPTRLGRVSWQAQPAAGSAGNGQLRRLRQDLARSEAKLADADFVAKAPPAVVEKERARLAEYRSAIERLTDY
jgi:valyl-tRNA synthetase